ncbi:MAG: hypothetical protein CUN56_07020 [Phototrophicales bacterium]|nr:MAG: hypothetical protein CUN56_07020 [Phototrophicales bacterium]
MGVDVDVGISVGNGVGVKVGGSVGARLMIVPSGADAALKLVSLVGVASKASGGIKRVGNALSSSVEVEPHAVNSPIIINHNKP